MLAVPGLPRLYHLHILPTSPTLLTYLAFLAYVVFLSLVCLYMLMCERTYLVWLERLADVCHDDVDAIAHWGTRTIFVDESFCHEFCAE